MKKIVITDEQKDNIINALSEEMKKKKRKKKTPSIYDQVKGVNAGIMDMVAMGGVMGESVEKDKCKKEQDFNKYCQKILEFMSENGMNIKPYPTIELDDSEQEGLFIKTGYYLPDEKKVVLFTNGRHLKDILRSLAHEMIHHEQNMDGKKLLYTAEDNVATNSDLENIESEAYLKGNIMFRKWTENENRQLNESKNSNIEEDISADNVNLSSFNIKDNLNPKFWKDGKLDSRIRLQLLDIADDFIDTLNVDWAKPSDIVITGSIANYNWNRKFSDIDLHIMYDFSEVDENTDFVKEYFDSKKKIWNKEHENIKIYGFSVELYVQDINEEHTSTGVYSIESDEWVTEPKREVLAKSKVNKDYIKNKIASYVNLIDELQEQYTKAGDDKHLLEVVKEKASKLFEKIRKERANSLSGKDTEITNGNIIFKALRRSGHIGTLIDLKSLTYDAIKSIRN